MVRRESHKIVYSTAHICNMEQSAWQNVFTQTV